MFDILAITSPIYLVIAIGYGLTRYGLFAKLDMRLFGKFVINLALPALLLRSLTQRHFSEILNTGYLLAYLAGSLVMLAVGYVYARRVAGQDATGSAIYAMGMCSSNSGFVGYPILLLTLAPLAGVALALNMLVENLVVIPLLLLLAGHGQSNASGWQALGQAFARLVRMPLIHALVLGMAVSLSGWTLPGVLAQTINMFANASGVLSLFVIGGALVGLPLRGMGRRVLPVVLSKLLLHPLLVALFISALPLLGMAALDPNLRLAAILMAAMPMMGIYPTLAQAYGKEDFSAAALLAATASSFVSLSALLWFLRRG